MPSSAKRRSRLLHEVPIATAELHRLVGTGELYAVLDACDAPAVLDRVAALGEERALCLYQGGAEDHLAEIAPYLARVDGDTLLWLTETMWAEPWGVFAVTSTDLTTLRKHLRRFLLVESPQGEQWYFRFYDPRVLMKFLPTCTESELVEIFGPVASYGVTDPDTYGVRFLRRGPAPAAVEPAPQPEAERPIRIRMKRRPT